MALIAKDTNDYLEQMVLLTKRLCEITQNQLTELDSNELTDVKPLNDEVSRLAAAYSSETRRIAQNPDLLQSGNPALKAALRDCTEKFRDLMEKHENALERKMRLTEGLVQAIAKEAMNARPTPISYGAGGIKTAPARANTTAIALDRKA